MNEWPPEDKVVVADQGVERLLKDARQIHTADNLESIAEDDRARAIERLGTVDSFEELALALREIGVVTSERSGHTYEPEKLIERIEAAHALVRSAYKNYSTSPIHKGEPAPELSEAFVKETKAFDTITNTHGIRDTAIRLVVSGAAPLVS